jgi:uncharacterized membrane protein
VNEDTLQTSQPDPKRVRVRPSDEERRVVRAAFNRPMVALKAAHISERSLMERIAVGWTRMAGSTFFLVAHLVWFVIWIAWNTGTLGVVPVDPFPFGLLTTIVSLEAIVLSIFVLIGQSREAKISELRDELTLQINLRIESEVTKNLQLVAGLYTRMGFRFSEDDELREMLKVMDPEDMERELMARIRKVTAPVPAFSL